MVGSLYIHIPFCLSKCKYCDFYSVVCDDKRIDDKYIYALSQEIKYRLCKNNITEFHTIYIGGGTPSLLSDKQIELIFDSISSVVNIQEDAEISIEVNPDDITENFIETLNISKINRISCGIQTFNNESLQYCGRRADSFANEKALSLLKEYWKGDLSVDLICGLPYENKDSFRNTLEHIVSYEPDHISMYSLTIEDETPLGKLYNEGKLEYDFDNSDEMWLESYKYLMEHNYNQYEVSNFSLKGKECKHNLTYWNHKNYIGCGVGGTGTVYNSDGSGLRWTNTKDIKKYIDFWSFNNDESEIPQIGEDISIENSKFEFFMMGLRKRSGIKKSEYESIFNEQIPEKIIDIFNDWKKIKRLNIEQLNGDEVYSLNEEGILFLNSLLTQII